jgi:protoporphyrinogen oxidase
MPCRSIGAEWAAQRVGGLSLLAAVRSALFGSNGPRTLISEFRYPVLGPGMMWQRFGQAIATFGGQVRLNCEVVELRLAGGQVAGVLARQQDRLEQLGAEQFISSMPLDDLVARLSPPPPEEVLRAAAGLRYRSLVLVGLILNRPDLFPDNWIYIHDPAVRVGRIQNFRNWSAAMVPDGRQSCLGMEYFCTQGDDLWMRSDREMVQLAGEELVRLGLARPENLQDGAVVRQPKAYPVYDAAYRANVQVVRSFLATLGNFQTVGRNGMHRYNNQDHSMLTGILAARNLLGQDHDLWKTGADGSYLEARAAQPSRRRR